MSQGLRIFTKEQDPIMGDRVYIEESGCGCCGEMNEATLEGLKQHLAYLMEEMALTEKLILEWMKKP